MTKYYQTIEKDNYKFYQQNGYDIQCLEFHNNTIKYRFKDLFIPDSAEELKYWQYNKMINKFLFKK